MIRTKSQLDATNRPIRLALGSLMGVLLLVTLTACNDNGDLSISNNGPTDVTVDTGDDEITVDAGGGAVLLDNGCTSGDVTVKFTADQEVVLTGPVCPDQQIVIGDGTAWLEPASTSEA